MLETHRSARVISALAVMGVLAVAVAPASAGPPSGPGPGNSPNAQACQEGWQALIRADGTSFANPGECTSYAAKGGTLFYANEAPCLNGGYANYVGTEGQIFTTQAECVAYVRGGGVLQPKSTASLTVTLGPLNEGGFCPAKFEGSGLRPGSPIYLTQTDYAGQYTSVFDYVEDDGTYLLNTTYSSGVAAYLTGTTATGETITSNEATCGQPADPPPPPPPDEDPEGAA